MKILFFIDDIFSFELEYHKYFINSNCFYFVDISYEQMGFIEFDSEQELLDFKMYFDFFLVNRMNCDDFRVYLELRRVEYAF